MKRSLRTFLSLLASLLTACSLPAETTSDLTLEQGQVLTYADDPEQAFVFSQEQIESRFIGDYLKWSVQDIGSIPRRDAYLFGVAPACGCGKAFMKT